MAGIANAKPPNATSVIRNRYVQAQIQKRMISNADFIAELKYFTPEQGGRNTPANSGYRPQLKFDFTDMQTSGHQFFIGTNTVDPGETVLAQIGMNTTHFFKNKLAVGMEFEFREGTAIIGIGKITQILNKSIEK